MSHDSSDKLHQTPYSSASIIIILILILLICFFVGFFSMYFFRCLLDNVFGSWNLRSGFPGRLVILSRDKANHGLEPKLVQLFPSLAYSSFQRFKHQSYGVELECAICLEQFHDDSFVRFLTVCCHIFHRVCIDLWFKSHKTCPVCRLDLDLPQKILEETSKSFVYNAMRNVNRRNPALEGYVRIDIREDEDEKVMQKNGAPTILEQIESVGKVVACSRSDSTGYHIRTREEKQKYLLGFVDHVKATSIRHNRIRSCITFGELSSHTTSTLFGSLSDVSRRSGRFINT